MKAVLVLSTFLLSSPLFANSSGSRVSEIWQQLQSDQYSKPQNKISFWKIGGVLGKKIKRAAERTLNDHSDLLPQFDKLAHPNGVCLKGEWRIDTVNRYSGYFKNGSVGQIIVRASTAMSATKRGKHRAFGFAGKLYPTQDFDHAQSLKTANFFLVDDLGGTKAPNYTGVGMTNEPKTSKTTAILMNMAYALKLAATFGKADSHPGVRQVYEISELGETDLSSVVTPKWMKVEAVKGQKVDEEDFRDELNIDHYAGALTFDILVASSENEEGDKNWKRVGSITLDDSVVSNSCDHRLHFHHPKWKSNLNH